MKVHHKHTTPDYREAQEVFNRFKKVGTAYMTYDYPTHEYTVELTQISHGTADLMRATLTGMWATMKLNTEERDALAYADSAIKTLQDMGVIK